MKRIKTPITTTITTIMIIKRKWKNKEICIYRLFCAFCCCCFESFFNRCFLNTLSSWTIRLWQERSYSGLWIPCLVYLTFRFWFKDRIFVIRGVKRWINCIEKYTIIIINYKYNSIQIKQIIFLWFHILKSSSWWTLSIFSIDWSSSSSGCILVIFVDFDVLFDVVE